MRVSAREIWWRWRDSNPRPSDYDSPALPTELHRLGEKGGDSLRENLCTIAREKLWSNPCNEKHPAKDFSDVPSPSGLPWSGGHVLS